MADIVKIYTGKQIYDLQRNLLLAKALGLTDFNDGSKIKAIIQVNSDLVSAIGSDFKEGIYNAIPIALYEGLGFTRKSAGNAIGYIRLYRRPMMVISYSGAATSVLLTSTSSLMSATCTGAPSDAFSFSYTTYSTVDTLAAAIDALTNWSCTVVKSGNSADLYQYSAVELLGQTDYLNANGMDIMLATDTDITVTEGFSVTIDSMQIITTVEGIVAAGESGAVISAQNTTAGTVGNISAGALDTLNGKGFINSVIDGIEHVKNDSAFAGGRLQETNEERAIRFADTINALNAGTKNGIIVALEKIDSVRSVGIRTSYPFRGTNTIIVDDGSGTLSTDLQTECNKILDGDPDDQENYPGKGVAGIGYILTAPTIVDTSISITAYRLSTVKVDLDEIKTDIQTKVEQYINTLKQGMDVILSEVIRVAKNANAAVYDIIITSPASNVSIDDGEMARTGSGTSGVITVTMAILTTP